MPRRARDDLGQQHVIGAFILMPRARREVERALAKHEAKRLARGSANGRPAGTQRAPCDCAGRSVVEQMLDTDRLARNPSARARYLRMSSCSLSFPSCDQQRDRHAGELLGHRGDVERRVGGDRPLGFHIGEAEGFAPSPACHPGRWRPRSLVRPAWRRPAWQGRPRLAEAGMGPRRSASEQRGSPPACSTESPSTRLQMNRFRASAPFKSAARSFRRTVESFRPQAPAVESNRPARNSTSCVSAVPQGLVDVS